ncbi:cupin domain-containing protein [Cyclobacterium sp. GBPx2]|uniref:Cupin domain-containing protein n=2 Tax=Cyclobacterium plantarum TaxID=2716263 RepID=A0ABX0H6W2_9BACT|nr:cupin domain-containing protein [Cyclobacterium plantarum]
MVLAQQKQIIRISEIEIFPEYLSGYKSILKTEAEASVRLEAEVISIFPMFQKEDSTQIRILEIYADEEAYKSHIATPHFQQYKTTTLEMVKSLKLVDMSAIDLETMNKIFKKEMETENKQELEAIFPKGEKGSNEFFTGNANNFGFQLDSVFTTVAGNVYFKPGARSNWHTHPSGQILIITDGVGYHQIEGHPIEVIKKGDVVQCPPNVRHWHGASEDVGLQQIYIVPNTEKGIVNWQEAVTDLVYRTRTE